MRVGFVEGVLPVMLFMFLFNVSSFPLMFYVLYVLVFFVANFSGAFCLNVVRICWGCCDLTIWIWGQCCVKVVYDFLVFYSFQFFIRFLLLFYLFYKVAFECLWVKRRFCSWRSYPFGLWRWLWFLLNGWLNYFFWFLLFLRCFFLCWLWYCFFLGFFIINIFYDYLCHILIL